MRIVSDEFEKVRNVLSAAFVADAFNEGVLLIVDFFGIERRVVDEYLDAIRARFFQPTDRPVIEEVGNAPGPVVVVSRLFVRKQQARTFVAALRGRQSVLRIEQDSAGILCKHFSDDALELFQHALGDIRHALFLGKSLLQRSALIHCRRRDYASRIGDCFHAGQFSGCQLHGNSSLGIS